jgi:glycosidase
MYLGCSSDEDPTTENNITNLHVLSPAWQDQIIYFIMIDRFNDGNPENNNQGMDEFDPNDGRKFSGGDLQGIIDKLDYIKNLGATAIWITPPVANQWWDSIASFGGYHGYWAENFKEIDKHFGDLKDYKTLSSKLHDRGMYLIQDIVVNHTGNFFSYNGEFNQSDPTENFIINTKSVPHSRPTQYPFNLNDVRLQENREADIYHWTPGIFDYNDHFQLLNYQLADLDDLNTENAIVRKYLRDAYGYWIKEVGIDGYRIDTIIYVELGFWNGFVYAIDPKYPGINVVAESTGKNSFLTFGEAFIGSDPFDDNGDKKIVKYLGTDESPALQSVLNFPLHFSINRVFGEGKPTSYLSYRLNVFCNSSLYKNPFIIPNFIDNHDVQRFLSTAKESALKQSLFLLMTIPGIPVIYQGTEQMFTKARASMFSSGWGSMGSDHFSESSEIYKLIQDLAAIRTGSKIFTRGTLTILKDSPFNPGVLVYQREYNNQKAIVIFNTADQNILLSNLETGLTAGTKLKLLIGIGLNDDINVGYDSKINLELSSRASGIYLVSDDSVTATNPDVSINFDKDPSGKIFNDDFTISGTVNRYVSGLKLLIDDRLESSLDVKLDQDNSWEVSVPISLFSWGKTNHSLVIYNPDEQIVSESKSITTDVPIIGTSIKAEDPLHDDFGPSGNYSAPKEATFGGQMDIESVEVNSFGGNLQISVTMNEVTDYWSPPNGFDHVAFHIFIDLPGKDGEIILPKLDAIAPEGFDWDILNLASGWNNVIYSSEGANKDNFGTFVIPAPEIKVKKDNRKIIFKFHPEVFGYPQNLEGTKIYITTWDGSGSEGFHRPLTINGGPFEFGGREGEHSPLIFDDINVILIPLK